MNKYHEFLKTLPFDLYDLILFSLVAETGSFTRAGSKAQLTQSAMTRRMAAMENKLGIPLFERTTRRVRLTSAGRDLLTRVEPILARTIEITAAFATRHGLRPPELSIGVGRSIGLAHLPGFFFAFQKTSPEVLLNISQRDSQEILRGVEAGDFDAGLVCPPPSLPRGLVATHRFSDDFLIIVPPGFPRPDGPLSPKTAWKLLRGERWLSIKQTSNTGQALNAWLKKQTWSISPSMELDSFDLIVNLVSLGMGVAMVPHRVLPIYERRKTVGRISLKPRFRRELAVVVRKERTKLFPLKDFIEQVLF